MNMFDEARSVRGMIEMCDITQSQMAKKLGVSQSYVANKLRLLSLTPDEEKKILAAGLSERHARALLRLTDCEQRLEAIAKVTDRRLTVRETEALVDMLHDSTAPNLIGKGARLEGVNTFVDILHSSITNLCSIGVSARQTTSYYGRKMYITICIEE